MRTLTSNNAFSDTKVMVKRTLRHAVRSKDTIITSVIFPIFMMLFFVNIFGGSIHTGSTSYISFVTPGIVLMSIVMGVSYAAMRLSSDLAKGILDRFSSLPIARSSILSGHVITSVIFNMVAVAAVLGVAFLSGFRSSASLTAWFEVGGLLLLLATALSWMSMIFGLLSKTPAGASALSYLLLLLVFVSSAFTPAASMGSAVRAFSKHQPMTPIIETVRSLLLHGVIGPNGTAALIWCVVLLVVCCPVAVRIYANKAK